LNIFYLKIGITTLNKIIYSTYSNFWQSEMRLQMICTVKTYLFISKLITILKVHKSPQVWNQLWTVMFALSLQGCHSYIIPH